MTFPWNFTLNVNLQEGAVQQLDFLQEVVSHPALDDDKVLKHSLYRYENYWLPLAGKHPNETLAAPLDVEWMWLCHMLSPVDYQRDCNILVGRVVSHMLHSAMQRRKLQQKARSLWQVEYPQEPFHAELDSDLFYTDDDLPSRLSYDILAAAARQKIFFYQVSLPHFKDAQFLATSELRYKRFLYLKQQHQDVALVPSHDIDLMWHTHMLHPLAYKIDTETILGCVLPHDKLLDGPNPEIHLSEALAETRELWKRSFDDVNFEVCGSTYRGRSTCGRLHALTPQQNFMASTKTATFIIEKVDVQGLPQLKGKLVFKLYTGLNGKIGKCAATFKGEPPWQGKTVPATDFETETVNYLKIRVLDQTGVLACFGTREIVGEKDIDLRPTLDSLTHETSVEHSVSLSQVYGATVAHITTHFCWPQRGPVHLYLRVGIFTHSAVPECPESVFCHVPIRKVPKEITNATYLSASHSLVNHSESVVLTCRVLHSVDLLQSAVYVHYQDKVAAVAHLVGLDHLPLPTQISDPHKVPYLNPRAGERAVLIKNHIGDWAVIVGRWTAVRKGRGSRMGSRRGKDGLPGHLMIRVREMADFGWRELQLTYSDQQWRFTLDDLHADLKDGTIRIDNPDSQHIAEKVALTFGVALLHVLCMPRPSGWRRGTSLRPRSRRGTRSSKWIPSEEMPFILAAGVLQETPTNGYIRQTHGTSAWTSERESLLGPGNTDLLHCRAEDGLGGMWAHVTPALSELFVQGSHVVPDGNSGCSMQIFPDGSSSCSQIFIDTSACSPPNSATLRDLGSPSSQAASERGGGGTGVATATGVGGGGGEAEAKSPLPPALSVLAVPRASGNRSSTMPSSSSCSSSVAGSSATHHEPNNNPSVVSTLTLPSSRDGGGSCSMTAGEPPLDKNPDSPPVQVLKEKPAGPSSSGVHVAVADAANRPSPALAATAAAASSGKTISVIKSPSAGLPGETSLGISALAMLGGKLGATHTARILTPALPYVNIEETPPPPAPPATPVSPRACDPEPVSPSPLLRTTPAAGQGLVVPFPGAGPIHNGSEEEKEEEGEKEEESCPPVVKASVDERSPDDDDNDGDVVVDKGARDEQTPTCSSSSSSSSFQTCGDLNPISSMLDILSGMPDFRRGGRLGARDMIDICEERIYSDYRCSVETGGVDDLITNDTKFEKADEEIVVAVQSRRNSRRKDAAGRKTRTSSSTSTGGAGVVTSFGSTSSAEIVASLGSTSAADTSFASNLTAALSVFVDDVDKDTSPSSSARDGAVGDEKRLSGNMGGVSALNGSCAEDSYG